MLVLPLLCALFAPGENILLVMALEAEEGVSPSITRQLDEALAAAVSRSGGFRVYGQADLVAMLELGVTKQVAGCNDDGCVAEVGGALGAERAVYGKVGALGDRLVLSLKLVNVRAGTVEARFSERIDDGPAGLLDAVERAVPTLLAPAHAALAPPSAYRAPWRGRVALSLAGAGALLVGLGGYEHVLAVRAARDVEAFAAEGGQWTAERARRESDGESATRRALVLDGGGLLLLAGAAALWWLGDDGAGAPTLSASRGRELTLGWGGAW